MAPSRLPNHETTARCIPASNVSAASRHEASKPVSAFMGHVLVSLYSVYSPAWSAVMLGLAIPSREVMGTKVKMNPPLSHPVDEIVELGPQQWRPARDVASWDVRRSGGDACPVTVGARCHHARFYLDCLDLPSCTHELNLDVARRHGKRSSHSSAARTQIWRPPQRAGARRAPKCAQRTSSKNSTAQENSSVPTVNESNSNPLAHGKFFSSM